MIVDDLRRSFAEGQCEVSARVRRGGSEELRLWYRFPEELAPDQLDGSPFLVGSILWAMRHGEDITVDAPVSPRLLANLERIVAVYWSLFPSQTRRISVMAPEAVAPEPGHVLTACFFSRGVDSWYAVLTALEDDPQQPPLTHVVFSPDFLPDGWRRERVREKTAGAVAAAEQTGCRVLRVYTNQKRDFRGAQLAASALAMGVARMLIPSGYMHGEIMPCGTHPVLDWRFSTERTEIIHYGDANRLTKHGRVAQSQLALDTLNVCRFNRGEGDRNCGRCEKCLRTMLELHAVGALDRGPAFDQPLDPRGVAGMRKRLGTNRHHWVEVLHALGDSTRDLELAAAVRLAIAQSDLRSAAYTLREAAADPALEAVVSDLPAATRRAHDLALWSHELTRPRTGNGRGEWRERLALRLRPTAASGQTDVADPDR
jgi:hypothetical protein